MDIKRLSKLPLWAQKHIQHQERQIENLDTALRELKLTTEEGCSGNVFRQSFIGGGYTEFNLPEHDNYNFIVNNGDERIMVKVREEGLSLMAYNGCIAVYPQSSNHVIIRGQNHEPYNL